nr:ribosomal protein L23 [Limnocharis flava]
MDGIKYPVLTEKSIRLLGNNQYTSNVESGSTRTEIKHWVELFFGVKVIAMNSHRLPGKGRRVGPIMGHTMHDRRMIITLQPGDSISPLIEVIREPLIELIANPATYGASREYREKNFKQNTE